MEPFSFPIKQITAENGFIFWKHCSMASRNNAHFFPNLSHCVLRYSIWYTFSTDTFNSVSWTFAIIFTVFVLIRCIFNLVFICISVNYDMKVLGNIVVHQFSFMYIHTTSTCIFLLVCTYSYCSELQLHENLLFKSIPQEKRF